MDGLTRASITFLLAAGMVNAAGPSRPTEAQARGTSDQIVYYGELDTGIHVINPDGSGDVAIRTGVYNSCPAWSPDRTQIAFASERGHYLLGDDLYMMNADGSGLVNLTTDFYERVGCPKWSPDATRLAFFAGNRYGLNSLWIMDIATRAHHQVSGSVVNTGGVSWSPAGDRLVFSADYGGLFNLWLVDVDGSNLTNLTSTNDVEEWPDWSPDGSLILYSKLRGRWEVWTIHPDGTDPTRVSPTTKYSYLPAWSPDQRHIVFRRTDDLWVMNSDGTGTYAITEGAYAVWPDW